MFIYVFIDTLRNINNGQLAALIVKGIEQYSENTDKLIGTIDIWWIVRILFEFKSETVLGDVSVEILDYLLCSQQVGEARVRRGVGEGGWGEEPR